MTWREIALRLDLLSDVDQVDLWIEPAQIVGIGSDDRLLSAAGADHDVRISKIGLHAECQPASDLYGLIALNLGRHPRPS